VNAAGVAQANNVGFFSIGAPRTIVVSVKYAF